MRFSFLTTNREDTGFWAPRSKDGFLLLWQEEGCFDLKINYQERTKMAA